MKPVNVLHYTSKGTLLMCLNKGLWDGKIILCYPVGPKVNTRVPKKMEEKGRSDRGDVTMAASVEHRSLGGAYYVFPHRVNLFSIASLCTFYFPSEHCHDRRWVCVIIWLMSVSFTNTHKGRDYVGFCFLLKFQFTMGTQQLFVK